MGTRALARAGLLGETLEMPMAGRAEMWPQPCPSRVEWMASDIRRRQQHPHRLGLSGRRRYETRHWRGPCRSPDKASPFLRLECQILRARGVPNVKIKLCDSSPSQAYFRAAHKGPALMDDNNANSHPWDVAKPRDGQIPSQRVHTRTYYPNVRRTRKKGRPERRRGLVFIARGGAPGLCRRGTTT